MTSIPILCGFTAAFLHYFMLVFFTWTAVEAILLYLKLVKIVGIERYTTNYSLKAGLCAWSKLLYYHWTINCTA